METNKKDLLKTIIILLLSISGIIITIYLAHVYYQANFNAYALPSACVLSEFMDCDSVAKTIESQFLGVPLAYWGMLLYSFIIMLLGAEWLKKIPGLKFLEVFKNKFHYIASLGIISFIISMILLCISLFTIKKLCVMCAITYAINLVIAIIAVQDLEGSIIGAIKQSFIDFIDALKPIPYRIAFIVVMLLACGFLGWTYTSAKFSPALQSQRNYGEFINAKTNKYAITGNILGSEDEDAIVVNVYSDYMCPMCNVFNMMVHKLAQEMTNVRIEHHSLPLDLDCNKYLTQPFHKGSCVAAKYAEAAHKQGKFWEVNSLLFDKRPVGEDAVIETIENAGFDIDMEQLKKDANSKEVEQAILKDIDFAAKNDQLGTPTFQIGEDFNMGIPEGGYPGLKKWVIERGGKPKGIHLF